MKFYKLTLALVLSFITFSCNEDGAESTDTSNPSDLSVDIIVSDDGSGAIDIVAVANNAIEYYFDLGEGDDPVTNTTGELSHTYASSGVYEIEVRAYGSSGNFVKEQSTVTSGTPSYEGMTLVWQDEFSGNSLNTDAWTYEIGTGSDGWGNQELQYYRSENATVSDGYLTIEAKEESYEGSNYTSSRIITRDKKSFKYGRIDIRALLPQGQGIWPALWMLGANFTSVGWPACGEIDIMEMIGGGSENTVHGTLHYFRNGQYGSQGGKYTLSSGSYFYDAYHVFSIIWDEEEIKWYVDDILYSKIATTDTELSEFHNEFFFIFNVAVGGRWPGSPDATTNFPQQMKVDYVRVFQENE